MGKGRLGDMDQLRVGSVERNAARECPSLLHVSELFGPCSDGTLESGPTPRVSKRQRHPKSCLLLDILIGPFSLGCTHRAFESGMSQTL